MLIVKKFNNEIFLGIPLSSKQKSKDFYFNYIDPYGKKVSAILAQIRMISIKRITRKLYVLDQKNFSEIKTVLRNFFT